MDHPKPDDNSMGFRIDYLKYVLSHLQDQIRFADSKAHFLYTFGILFLLLVLSTFYRFNILDRSFSYDSEKGTIIVLVLFSCYIIVTIFGIIHINLILFPRINVNRMKSIDHFNDINALSTREYKNIIQDLTQDEVFQYLSNQIRITSRIAKIKYEYIKKSMTLFQIGLILGLIYLIISPLV